MRRNGNNGSSRTPPVIRCAIYTRKSTDEGLDQEFNSLDAQREAAEAFIRSQAGEGWTVLPERYDDGGFTGGNMDRPALQRLLYDIEAGRVDCVVVYKVDRLSRSLLDFARLMETFERHKVSFVSVTQQFNTATSMGRLVLNVLLSFAQFEREIISERTRDKIAATRRKGRWCGGRPILGYDLDRQGSRLIVNPDEAAQVRAIFQLYLDYEGLMPVVEELRRRGWRNKRWITRKGIERGGREFDKNSLWHLLTNVTYLGKVRYKDEIHDGQHEAIVDVDLWQRVQALLARNGRMGGTWVRNKFGALLKGLLRCAACGCAMVHTHTTRDRIKRYRYYVCTAAQKRGPGTCPTGSIPAGQIEEFVVEQIKCIGRDPRLVAATVRQLQAQASRGTEELAAEEARLQRELGDYDLQLHTVVMQPSTEGDIERTTARLADLQERIAVAQRRLVEVRERAERLQCGTLDPTEVARALAEFDPVWESLTAHEQARLLHLFIERIDYDGREGLISITFHPTGIKMLLNRQAEGDAA
ncbi:MAG TPA: recombinase family protein [Bryobacteraceae bacterium]|nr:recombinase family protein [Bryobacteraceae bacterium]